MQRVYHGSVAPYEALPEPCQDGGVMPRLLRLPTRSLGRGARYPVRVVLHVSRKHDGGEQRVWRHASVRCYACGVTVACTHFVRSRAGVHDVCAAACMQFGANTARQHKKSTVKQTQKERNALAREERMHIERGFVIHQGRVMYKRCDGVYIEPNPDGTVDVD
eukprot:3713114-Rhodomonas_salina.3